jgi:hypothetical protein
MYTGSGDDCIMAIEAPSRHPNLKGREGVYCGPGEDKIPYCRGVDQIVDRESKNPRRS